jgi:hypothetical protein
MERLIFLGPRAIGVHAAGTVKDDPRKINRPVAAVVELAAPSGNELRPKKLDLP